jgi:ABC-type multidrug transport system ATPase subunit
MTEVIQVRDLTKQFRLSQKQQRLEKSKEKVKVAVDHLSFSVYEGEIFGLLGPNGAGKTTTLRILSTLMKPDSGDAFLRGVSVVEHAGEIRGKIGFLTSELKLEEFFTPNYLFDFFSTLHKVDPQIRERRKKELFQQFGITSFAEVKVANLSTGMKQKVSLAVSLVHDPDVIIFDEPTNGLDVLTAKIVMDFLLHLKSQGKTIVVSTHIFSLIEKIGDRVGIIIDGKMVACDSLDAIRQGRSLEDVFFDIYAEKVGDV